MKVRAFFPFTLAIDGEEIVFRLKRMTMEEHSDFLARGSKSGTPSHLRFICRESSGPEQERDEKGNYKIHFDDLIVQKLEALGPEKLAEYQAAEAAREIESRAFLIYVFESFVTVERGLLEELPDGNEQSVVDGLDVLRIFGARNDVLSKILEAVRFENELTPEEKKTWRSDSDSSTISTELESDQVGPKPETTVESVKTGDSAGTADASSRAPGPSGSTDPLSSDRVPSTP